MAWLNLDCILSLYTTTLIPKVRFRHSPIPTDLPSASRVSSAGQEVRDKEEMQDTEKRRRLSVSCLRPFVRYANLVAQLRFKREGKLHVAKAKRYGPRPSVRVTDDEICELRKRAKDAKLSLSRYLVECGLGSENPPDPRERELREHALFEIRKAGAGLNLIVRRLDRQAMTLDKEQIERAIRETAEAMKALFDAFGRRVSAEEKSAIAAR